MPIDESLAFKPVRVAVLTISDSRGPTDDRSGDKLTALLTGAGHILAARAIIRDEIDLIVSRLHNWIDDAQIDAVITTGGTGLTGRDVTPEALRRLDGKDIPGRSEEHTSELQSLMRISSAVFCLKKKQQKTNTPNH